MTISSKNNAKQIYFAAAGDVHGHMNKFVSVLENWEKYNKKSLKFVLQVGDFEPHRNESDLSSMAAPSKYRDLGDFNLYYSGKKRFPWPVFFIGGNHEPYGYLDSEPSGFELVKNCNYMGRAEMIEFAGLSIAGLSGIYSEHKFNITRPDPSKINKISNKEYIYFNESEVEKLADCKSVDILLLHEWPSDIISTKDEAEFENQRRSMRYDSIGNEYAKMLVDILNPKLVLCGHMHKKYQNSIQLESGSKSDIVCLASIHQGDDVFEVFSSSKNTISRL